VQLYLHAHSCCSASWHITKVKTLTRGLGLGFEFWPLDLSVSAWRGPTMYCMPTDFCAASLSRLSIKVTITQIRVRVSIWPDLLTSGSVHAEVLLWNRCLSTLVLIAQAIFLLECGQTNRQTDVTECPTHAGSYTAGVGNDSAYISFSKAKPLVLRRITHFRLLCALRVF